MLINRPPLDAAPLAPNSQLYTSPPPSMIRATAPLALLALLLAPQAVSAEGQCVACTCLTCNCQLCSQPLLLTAPLLPCARPPLFRRSPDGECGSGASAAAAAAAADLPPTACLQSIRLCGPALPPPAQIPLTLPSRRAINHDAVSAPDADPNPHALPADAMLPSTEPVPLEMRVAAADVGVTLVHPRIEVNKLFTEDRYSKYKVGGWVGGRTMDAHLGDGRVGE